MFDWLHKLDGRDGLLAAALTLITAGMWQWSWPAALVTLGALLGGVWLMPYLPLKRGGGNGPVR